MQTLTVEINADFAEANTTITTGSMQFQLTPPLDEDYWLFRVKLFEDQAIVGFPKFSTIGIGFAQEEDWNTNLPYTCEPEMIYNHIKHNKKHDEITDEQCIEAIQRIQQAIAHVAKTQEEASKENAHPDWKLYAYVHGIMTRIVAGELVRQDDAEIARIRASYQVTEAEQEAVADLILNGLENE